MKVYGQLEFAQAHNAAADLSSTAAGIVYFNTTDNVMKWYAAAAWRTAVTTNQTQALTNKDYDGGTASNTSRLTVPKNTKTNLDGLTRKEGTVVYSTDLTKLFYDDGSTLRDIGSGSGGGAFNYVLNPDASTDASSSTAVTGTFARSRGTTETTFSDSYFIVTTGTTAAGTMSWSLDTLNAKHNGQLMLVSAHFKVPTTSGTYKVGLYNSTDAAYVTGTESTLVTGENRIWKALFVLDTSKTYVVRFERTAGTSDETFYFDDVKVTPEQTIATAALGPWRSGGTGLFSASGGTQSFFYRQVGDTMEFIAHIANATWSGSSTLLFTLPNNLTANTSFLTTRQALGKVIAQDSSANDYFSGTAMYSGTSTTGQIQIGGDLADSVWNGSGARPFAWADAGDVLSIHASIPIAEWAGAVQTVANSRVEFASVSGTWDAAASTTAYGPAGQLMGGALTAAREKTVTWQVPPTATDHISVQFSKDGITWAEANSARIGSSNNAVIPGVNAAGTVSSGVQYRSGAAANQTIVTFNQYMSMANDDAPTVDWPSSDAYWRVVKSANPLGIGAGLATADQAGAVPNYETTTFTLDGTFSSGTAKLTKIGNFVTVTSTGLWSHTSSAAPITTSAIPSQFRPANTVGNCYVLGTAEFSSIEVLTDGTIRLRHKSTSTGADSARTNSNISPTISYVV
jgi:hypothetical protein